MKTKQIIRKFGKNNPIKRNALLLMILSTISVHANPQIVAQTPLQVNVNVPGNLALVPSVEWPTINSVANLGDYNPNTIYAGYFDSRKCYQYIWHSNESERHFRPVRTTLDQRCTNNDAPWSGNFLNWATTQTIDAFRSALTGGLRVRDTTTETWLEKARHDGQGGTAIFPNRRLPSSGADRDLLSGATPFSQRNSSENFIRMRIQGLGNRMRIRVGSDNIDDNVWEFNPASRDRRDCDENSCELSIRVAVCVNNLLEPNCVQYGNNWKPEGTLQANNQTMRFSVFGYLNDSQILRDGGVMRSRMKFIGPLMPDLSNPLRPLIVNPRREWDPTTGILISNPDPSDASDTSQAVGSTIQNSGVINYINRFGQTTTTNHKSFDPVSELFYAASRYFRNLGNVPEFSNLTGDATSRMNQADGFPVITNWSDPILYWCQPNTILGIGDIYSHRDKNLPGNNTHRSEEPPMPASVSSDTEIDVLALTNTVASMEGISISLSNFTGRNNSAFIAGLAWDLRSRNIRPDLRGGPVHVSTFWVDVLEAQSLEGMARNQYALAAKFGGARLPTNFNRATWGNQALPTAWWHTNGETLTPFGRGNNQASFLRPDNFFVAGNANQMIISLQRAFRSIHAERDGSGVALAANTTELRTDSRVFQAKFFSGSWRGELSAFDVNPQSGQLSVVPVWQAGNVLPTWDQRRIFFNDGQNRLAPFTWSSIPINLRSHLVSENVVNYLRGDRRLEVQNGGTFRDRTGALGHIVHSRPVLVSSPDPRRFLNATFNGSSSYAAFATAQANRSSTIYVGTNGGKLHGFDAHTGIETFAFVPSQVIRNNLASLSDQFYTHRYFVDGEIATADVFINNAWRTVLVGTLGRGGPGVFALDVTDPNNITLLWEREADDIPNLGRNIGTPIIAQVANGDWRVILGNGPDNAGNRAELISIRLDNGTVSTLGTSISNASGLTSAYVFDSNNDGFKDSAYAGDLQGNLWRFSNLGQSSNSAIRLFQAAVSENNIQPITAAPLSTVNPADGRRWVFFGTGRFLSQTDPASKNVQTWYGIIDSGTFITRSSLVPRRIEAEGRVGEFTGRVIQSATANDMANRQGWFIDLVSPVGGNEGERMVLPNQLERGRLIGTTRIPDSSDLCRPSGRGFVMAIDPFTGARFENSFFDFNRDNIFNDSDRLLFNNQLNFVSGIGFISSPNSPIFVGRFMQVSLDDGTIENIPTPPSLRVLRRTSWREIVR